MSARSRKLLIAGMVTFLVACIAGIVVVAPSLLSLQYQQAHRRWEQQGLRHYELEVAWANGWSFGHALVEMRDNQLVKGIDLDTGQPLGPGKLLSAAYFGSIDNLFQIVSERVRPSWGWRVQLARLSPLFARWGDPCVAPLSEVSYDAQFGYPTTISYNDSWCAKTFFNYSNVQIKRFTPLP